MTTISQLRFNLVNEFTHLSNSENIPINFSSDIRILDICERLIDERRGSRRINIDLDRDMSLPMNGFVKSLEIDGEDIALLTVFVNEEGVDSKQLWAVYRAWLHDNLDAEAVLELR